MMAWLWSQCLPLTLLLGLLLMVRPLILKYAGARCQYSLWLAVPLSLLCSVLPASVWPPQAAQGITTFRVVAGKLNSQFVQQAADLSALAWLWLAGIVVLGLSLVGQYRTLRRALRGAAGAELHGVEVLSGRSLQGPLVCGLFRPLLLLPNDFTQRFSAEQQQLIIAHELTHWRRGDLHANALAIALLVLFWFHPLCWLAYRAYRQDQELACDALVLRAASPRQKIAYSHALLSSTQSSNASWQLLTHHYGEKQMMKQRLQQLQRQQGFSKTAMALTLILLAGATLWLQQPALAGAAADQVKPVTRVEPRYPVQAAQAKIEGYVIAEFDVQPDGSVQNVNIIKSVPNQVFDKEAARALQQWTYTPSAGGAKKVNVQLDFMMDPVPVDVERVQVEPSKQQ